MVTEAQAYETMRVARIQAELAELANRPMHSSAQLCARDAEACFARLDWYHARERALKSLAYSVGILSPLYIKTAAR
jgi:hypothetical protein